MDIRNLQPLLRAKGVNVTDDDPVFLHLLLNQVVLDDVASGSQSGMRRLNIDKLQDVLRGHGIRIKNDDPIFALLALNEIALERMVEKQRQTLARVTAQRRLSASLLLLTAGCGAGAGIFFGRDGSHMVAGVSGIALGALLGWAATWLLSSAPAPAAPEIAPVAATQTAYSWTNDDFQRVISNMRTTLDPRVQRACREVLLAGKTLTQAAEEEKLAPKQIMRALDQIIERKDAKSWLL